MATYKFGRWIDHFDTTYYAIKRKTFFGWKEEKYWVVSNSMGNIIPEKDIQAKKSMMECVDRLIKAGNTVI